LNLESYNKHIVIHIGTSLQGKDIEASIDLSDEVDNNSTRWNGRKGRDSNKNS